MVLCGRLCDRDVEPLMKTPSFMLHQHFLVSFVPGMVLEEAPRLAGNVIDLSCESIAGGTKW